MNNTINNDADNNRNDMKQGEVQNELQSQGTGESKLLDKIAKKRGLSTAELEEKILQRSEERKKTYKDKKQHKVNSSHTEAKPPKNLHWLKGAEKFDHRKYFGNQEPKSLKDMEKEDRQKFNFPKKLVANRSRINRLAMTAAVILVVMSAYIAIDKVNTSRLNNEILTVSDSVNQSEANKANEPKVEVLGQESGSEKQNAENKPTVNSGSSSSINSDNDYFINYALEREKIRGQQLELLEKMVDDDNTLPEVRKDAQLKIMGISKAIEQELLLESLLIAKYGSEAVVFVQPEKVNVILRQAPSKMSANEAEKIAQMVHTYTGIGYENAIIVIKE